MKAAIMQPYLFPYLGYFQLIKAADVFVIHDDVQYIKGGWINRNRILVNNQAYLFTFSIKKAPYYLPINQRFFSGDLYKEKKRFFNTLKFAYCRAPFYEEVIDLVNEIFNFQESNITLFIENSLVKLCSYMEIGTIFKRSSNLDKDTQLNGEQRVIAINQKLGADHYINPIGGTELYSNTEFARNGIRLSFIKSDEISYSQFNKNFVPSLSIIDVLMFNSRDKVKELLNEYELIG